MSATDDIAWVFKGGGFAPGIPARDLTKGEFDALSEVDQEVVRESGIYKAPEEPKATKSNKRSSTRSAGD